MGADGDTLGRRAGPMSHVAVTVAWMQPAWRWQLARPPGTVRIIDPLKRRAHETT